MTLEQVTYERGYHTCTRCKTRRPGRPLSDGICNDGWCERVQPAAPAVATLEAELAVASAFTGTITVEANAAIGEVRR